MGMGDYGEHCRNCDHFDGKQNGRRFCQLHRFVMPIASDNIICADWRLQGRNAPKSLSHNLVDGILYIWNPYLYAPKAIEQFEAIQELRVDVDVPLVENPDYGFAIYLSFREDVFPNPGETVTILLDEVPVEFLVRDIEITMTYTSQNAEGKLDKKDQREVQRTALPVNDAGSQVLLRWIDGHHNLAEARNIHLRNLENPRFLNKNKALRLFEKLKGNPKSRSFTLHPGYGIPLVPR